MRAMRFRLLVSRKKLFDAVQLAVNNHNRKAGFCRASQTPAANRYLSVRLGVRSRLVIKQRLKQIYAIAFAYQKNR